MNTTIVYHYVRDNSRLKGLTTHQFESQLEFISKNYRIITPSEMPGSKGETCTLTFDDGLKDGYGLLPLLEKHGAKAIFFVPMSILSSEKVLAVQKRHLLLANFGIEKFVEEFNEISEDEFKINRDAEIQNLWNSNRSKTCQDDILTANLKYRLDYSEPDVIKNILDKIFNKFFDEKKEFENIYMNREEIKELREKGMEFGIHGYNHIWLGKLSSWEQMLELEDAQNRFVEFFGFKPEYISYPHGSYNNSTIQLLKSLEFKLGYTIQEHKNINSKNPFELGRYDCASFEKKLKR